MDITISNPVQKTKFIAKKCIHEKRKYDCKECGGSKYCSHGKCKSYCKECKGVQ